MKNTYLRWKCRRYVLHPINFQMKGRDEVQYSLPFLTPFRVHRVTSMAKHYVNNRVLLQAFIDSRDSSMGPSLEIIDMWQQMAQRFSYNMTYVNPLDRDDIVQQGVIDCYMYWANFDPSKGTNAFAYFTQIIKNGAAKAWRTIHPVHFRKTTSLSHGDIWNL